MKIKLSIVAILYYALNASAQIYTPTGTIQGTSGNNSVGIGTNTPTSKLDVLGTIKSYEGTQLGQPVGSSQLINEIGGSCGTSNKMLNRSWLYRDNSSDSNWYYTRLHDGISIDGTYSMPQNNTRTWWERDPYDNIQSWGDGAITYFTINKGKMGVGTSAPESKLSIYSTYAEGWNSGLELLREDGGKGWIVVDSDGMKFRTPVDGDGYYFRDNDNNTSFFVADGGSVGIGTTSPSQKLEVNGNGLFQGAIISSKSSNEGGQIQIKNPSKTLNGTANTWTIYNMTGVYGNSLQFYAYDNIGCVSGGLCASRFTIMDSGNIGIGINNPTNKLDVNGTIHSKEVKVDMNGWSDFVFKKDYTLPTLEEVEKHIAEKGHLENIPSEEEVLKNGINLGEINSKLLQKIEELTLYVIEQNKQIEDLKSQNEDFKVVLERLKKIEEKLK